jgi:hypothetical protein
MRRAEPCSVARALGADDGDAGVKPMPTFIFSTDSSPLMMHSLRPVPSTMASYSSFMVLQVRTWRKRPRSAPEVKLGAKPKAPKAGFQNGRLCLWSGLRARAYLC